MTYPATSDDITTWTGDPAATAPFEASGAATLEIDTSAFADTKTAAEMQKIIADARVQLDATALRAFRQIGGQEAERHIASRRGLPYPA